MLRVLVAILVVLAVAPAAARAATVTPVDLCDDVAGGCYALLVDAPPGEANRMEVALAATAVTITDAGAGLRVAGSAPGLTCEARGAAEVRCREAQGTKLGISVLATLGDGDDRFTARGRGPARDVIAISAAGGPGADVLTGGDGRDSLDGGPGADVLAGGGGDDLLLEGDSDGAVADDRLDGGAGHDQATFSADLVGGAAPRVRPRTIDLGRGVATSSGETDRLASIESVRGGDGPDRILGTSRDERLDGDDGADEVRAGGGDDRVVADGRDRVDLGSGDDRIDLTNSEAAAPIRCGSGSDVVVDSAATTRLVACERLGSADPRGALLFDVSLAVRVRGATVRFVVRGSDDVDPGLRLLLRDGATGQLLGRGTVRLRGRRVRTVVVRVPPTTARRLRTRGLDVRVVAVHAQMSTGGRLRLRLAP